MFDAVDDALMYGSNKAVHAWNWTTGGTKSELANLLDVSATAGIISGTFGLDKIFGATFAPVLLLVCYMRNKNNKDKEMEEIAALRGGLINPRVESFKRLCKMGAAYQTMFSIAVAIHGEAALSKQNYVTAGADFVNSLSLLAHAASNYIMCADSLPPRKDCVTRGLDYLDGKLKQIGEKINKPAHVPQTIPVKYLEGMVQ